MKIIYVHHGEREKSGNREDPLVGNSEDLTPNGIKDAELVAKRFEDKKITAIVTSPYIRCKHTAEIINKYHNVPIIEDERFNELDYYNKERFKPFLKRNIEAIKDIVKKYTDDDVIICVTSGVNLSAFICYFYKIRPTHRTPWAQAIQTSPVAFTIGKWDL